MHWRWGVTKVVIPSKQKRKMNRRPTEKVAVFLPPLWSPSGCDRSEESYLRGSQIRLGQKNLTVEFLSRVQKLPSKLGPYDNVGKTTLMNNENPLILSRHDRNILKSWVFDGRSMKVIRKEEKVTFLECEEKDVQKPSFRIPPSTGTWFPENMN